MSSFGQGFITGFADSLATGIKDRREKADDYFEKQLEYARTTGLQNRKAAKAAADQNLSIARQLEAVGVPTDIVMAQINQNPDGLGDFYSEVEKIRAAAPNLTPEQWRGMIKVSGDFKASDEDLASFVRRTYDPITSAANSPEFEDDPQGTFMSRLLGFGAMDRARERLGETVVADGLTAEQLIQYGDVTPQRVGGNAVVTYDYQQFPKEPEKADEGLLRVTYEGLVKNLEERFSLELNGALTSGVDLKPGDDVTEIRNKILGDMLSQPLDVTPEVMTQLVDSFIRGKGFTFGNGTTTEAPETPTETPEAPPPTEGSPEPQTAPVEPPTAPTETGDKSFPEVFRTGDGVTLFFMSVNENGLGVYAGDDGNDYELALEAFN